MWILIAVGFVIAGIGWRVGQGQIETLGTLVGLTGVAMVIMEHWPSR